MEKSTDPDATAALRQFLSMPASTAVFANPVRYRHTVDCSGAPIDLSVRSFALRGLLTEEDIVNGAADGYRVIFVGLFGRFAKPGEATWLARAISRYFNQAAQAALSELAKFMKRFPDAPPEVAMQYMSAIRKAAGKELPINRSRPANETLMDLLSVHMSNVAVGACASYMRQATGPQTARFVHALPTKDPLRIVFSLLLRRAVSPVEARILDRLGSIQIHHGSAGSNMVARYLASLHTKSVDDLFTASRMALDSARHFGAISDMSVFIRELERKPAARRDQLIRERIIKRNLPTFGHPEIAAAGRGNRMEVDPRPAIYVTPLFEAIDAGSLVVPDAKRRRAELAQRIYQVAFVEGVEKPETSGPLRLTPNTDFGAWIVQEVLGIEEPDRTLLSYVYRGFGWMMDVREQLQQAIIRPVIPPDPAIVPEAGNDRTIPGILTAVHERLRGPDAFQKQSNESLIGGQDPPFDHKVGNGSPTSRRFLPTIS
jgi:citrate synthase